MRIRPSNPGHKREEGIIITLIAIFMLFVVGAMAALSIDVVTFYTARSEAQIAADSAALAAARVLANSGITSSGGATDPGPTETLAQSIATQVAQRNLIGGSTPQVTVNISLGNLNNPTVTVKVTRTDLPTFFARIWGTSTVAVSASAIAEAYNPSGLASGSSAISASPVESSCVKPWLLPNIDPSLTSATGNIFDPGTGAIQAPGLLGWQSLGPPPMPGTSVSVACPLGDCSGTLASSVWQYFPGDPETFTASSSSFSCPYSANFTPYQYSIAGCVQTPIACNQSIPIDRSNYGTRDSETALAVDCLIHSYTNNCDALPPKSCTPDGDSVDTNTSPPFEFLTGGLNPLVPKVLPALTDVMTSDSLVTVPVFDSSTPLGTSVKVIGFVQLFLQPNGSKVEAGGGISQYKIRTMVINMVGCGAQMPSGNAVYGNGPSAVPVRLIATPTAN